MLISTPNSSAQVHTREGFFWNMQPAMARSSPSSRSWLACLPLVIVPTVPTAILAPSFSLTRLAKGWGWRRGWVLAVSLHYFETMKERVRVWWRNAIWKSGRREGFFFWDLQLDIPARRGDVALDGCRRMRRRGGRHLCRIGSRLGGRCPRLSSFPCPFPVPASPLR